ncbi:MAG: hypothetical protein JNM26_00515 [Ideonella sp.]|nr:hypothetical protein [Ideonella sp.]
MFDDLLSALALIGVTGTLVAAATSLATGPADPVSAAVPPGPPLALRAAAPAAPSSAAPMPVHDLPRVVVTGHRLRDGDMLADGRDSARSAGGPR